LSPLPPWVHELVVAPAAYALAFLHARRALGGGRAALELLALTAYGYALELVAIHLFASHTYGRAWVVAPLGVPLAVAMVWAALIGSAMALAARTGRRTVSGRAAAAALVAVSLDLLMEPVAVRIGLWRWTPPGPWLGVPIGNFVGWAVIVACYAAGAERFARDGPAHREASIRLLLAVGSILALVAVGLAWRMLRVEWLFAGGRGWAAWAAILLAALAVGRRRRPLAEGEGLGARLGRAPGKGPEALFLGLAGVFAFDAAALGDPRLWLVAAGSAAALVRVSGTASSGS
jgi:uncharacterized membrane protein